MEHYDIFVQHGIVKNSQRDPLLYDSQTDAIIPAEFPDALNRYTDQYQQYLTQLVND